MHVGEWLCIAVIIVSFPNCVKFISPETFYVRAVIIDYVVKQYSQLVIIEYASQIPLIKDENWIGT